GAAQRKYFADSAGAAASFLARPDGPRIGALSFDGWDTHADEGAANGRLANLLGALDGALGAVETGMGPAWRETVVAVVTEFGRTARINGTEGTDHGTATIALLVGGAVKGGRVIADWPGLRDADLYQQRDLKPTTDLRAVLKGVLRDHVRVDEKVLAGPVVPHQGHRKAEGGPVAELLPQPRGLDHGCPLRDFGRDVCRDLGRAAADRLHALCAQRRDDLLRLQRGVDLARQGGHDLQWRTGRRQQTEPDGGVESRQAGLRHARHVRRDGRTSRLRHRESDQLAPLHV